MSDQTETPPHSLEAERSVLGSVMSDGEGLDEISLEPAAFFGAQNRMIFEALSHLKRNGRSPDLVSVVARLREINKLDEAGGVSELAKYLDDAAVASQLGTMSALISTMHHRRMVVSQCQKTVKALYATYPGAEPDKAMSSLQATLADSPGGARQTWAELGDVVRDRYNALAEKRGNAEFVPSYIPGLDKITNGFAKSDLIILAGRPSCGKTALAVQSAVELARADYPVVFGSAEMSRAQLGNRIMAYESGIEHERIRQSQVGPADDPALVTATGRLQDKPVIIDDRGSLRPSDLWGLVRKCRRRFGSCAAVFADYIQIMKPTSRKRGESREREVASISADLKELAKECCLPVIALCQLSRDVEKRQRTVSRPALPDLRESGSIEQDADMVLFTWYAAAIEFNEAKAEIMLTVAKQRNGPCGEIKNIFDKPHQQFRAQPQTNLC
ncbi:MAG: AAA family ATPase [Propionibacteriaceae bacterium]|nr:AAA family ATPase [Propionibacteriaceae bacterium]